MNKKRNRILTIAVAIFVAVSMTACGSKTAPEITAAPTTEPVSVCEANGHTWVEANYQQPKTCSVCEATEGEPLAAYFVKSGLEEKLLAPAGAYSYTMVCSDETQTAVANVIVEDYRTIASDETHEAVDGYQWKILSLKLHISDENAVNGFYLGKYLWTDKYLANIGEAEDYDDTVIVDLSGEGIPQTFEWNGAAHTNGWLRIEENLTEWMQDEEGNDYIDFFITVSVRVPVGYDGFVFGLDDHNWEWTEGKYLHEVITDNTLLFRMD